jgi:hypothetical protein
MFCFDSQHACLPCDYATRLRHWKWSTYELYEMVRFPFPPWRHLNVDSLCETFSILSALYLFKFCRLHVHTKFPRANTNQQRLCADMSSFESYCADSWLASASGRFKTHVFILMCSELIKGEQKHLTAKVLIIDTHNALLCLYPGVTRWHFIPV